MLDVGRHFLVHEITALSSAKDSGRGGWFADAGHYVEIQFDPRDSSLPATNTTLVLTILACNAMMPAETIPFFPSIAMRIRCDTHNGNQSPQMKARNFA
jgi:hypothetical protein